MSAIIAIADTVAKPATSRRLNGIGPIGGNRDEHRHAGELAELVDAVEGHVELFGGQHDGDGRRKGEQDAHEHQADAVRRRRSFGRKRRLEDAEPLALAIGLHAGRELRLVVPLQQRVVEILGGLAVARNQREFLLALRRAFEPLLEGADRPADRRFFAVWPAPRRGSRSSAGAAPWRRRRRRRRRASRPGRPRASSDRRVRPGPGRARAPRAAPAGGRRRDACS